MAGQSMGEHSGGQVGQLTGGNSPAGDHTNAMSATAANTRQFLVALLLLLAFVFVMTMLAGINPQVGAGITALFVAMFIVNAITHVNPFVHWVQTHPLTPN